MMFTRTVKRAARAALAAPGIRHGLKWFITQPRVPAPWRELAHRKLAKRARFGNRTFVYTTPAGVPLRFVHTGTTNYLYWLEEYEPETTAMFAALARTAGVVLDIGSADGLYAILAAAANPRARVLAFEPGEQAAQVLARNVALNATVASRVEQFTLALGDHDELATLYVAGESGGTSSLNAQFRANRDEQAVRVRRGDGLLAELGVSRVDLIKIDTESTEPAVLRGLHETLERDHPDVICEVLWGRTEAELDAIVRALGYRCYWMSTHGLVPRERIEGDRTYRAPNYLFTTRPHAEIERIYKSSNSRTAPR